MEEGKDGRHVALYRGIMINCDEKQNLYLSIQIDQLLNASKKKSKAA